MLTAVCLRWQYYSYLLCLTQYTANRRKKTKQTPFKTKKKKHFIHSKDIPANINLYNFLKTVLCFAVFQFFYVLLFSPTFQGLQPALDALLM